MSSDRKKPPLAFDPPPSSDWLAKAEHGKPMTVIDMNMPLPALLLDLAQKAFLPLFPDTLGEKLALAEAGHWFALLHKPIGGMAATAEAFGVDRKTYSAAVAERHRTREAETPLLFEKGASLYEQARAEFLRLTNERGFGA